MQILKGIYNEAKIFTDTLDSASLGQIQALLDQEFTVGSKIRIMPDAHAGMGCVIGTSMTVTDKAVPNMVGVDIGCGMETVELQDTRVNLPELDKAVRENIPAGFDIRKNAHKYADEANLESLRCVRHVNYERAMRSIGTLGGGNHFIELAKDGESRLYLTVHTGSRHLGKQIADFYQNAAYSALKKNGVKIAHALAYAEGRLLNDYLHDMSVAQEYASLNRKAITGAIIKKMKFKPSDNFTTIHNYIDTDSKILRKGAVSAKKGEKLLIPINMRDGSLICKGLGNPDWNFSAPHGAGRIMSRTEAKKA